MDVWGWIVVYAIGLTVLQLLVYRYLLNRGGSLTRRVGTPFGDNERDGSWSNGPSGSPGSGGSAQHPPESSREREESSSSSPNDAGRGSIPTTVGVWPEERMRVHPRPDGDGASGAGNRLCPHCGAENETDETFSLCWNCTRQL